MWKLCREALHVEHVLIGHCTSRLVQEGHTVHTPTDAELVCEARLTITLPDPDGKTH